jgi:ABC-type phosphate/phosphonate transport system ATPase subunit
MLESEFEYYKTHQAELVKKYLGKWIAIKQGEIVGVFNTQFDALEEVKKSHEQGTFLLQHVEEGADSYTQTFQSRVGV